MQALLHRFSLSDHNSFRIEVHAALFAAPGTLEQLSGVFDHYDPRSQPFLVIGEGSNILFRGDFKGLVVNPRMKGIELVEDDRDHVVVRVGAAENWDRWVTHATFHGWHGLENLSLIPGSVGSAPIQNIGAYGVELKDHFAWLDAWDLHLQRMVRLSGEQCHFGYRASIFKSEARGRYIITHVAFKLSKQPRLKLDYGPVKEAFLQSGGSSPMDLRNTIIAIRQKKLPDPEEFGNAGSFFKNPVVEPAKFNAIKAGYPGIPHFRDQENQVKLPAAWLIEQAGWKGKRVGKVGTWPKQSLVIVNYGGATGQEIFDFSELIRKDVLEKFGISLEREVNVV